MRSLESRYRRLLRAYPVDHRERHGEEMLAVLLAAARTGQRRPGVADTVDVIRGGVTIRSRHFLAHHRRPVWQDAWALVCLAAPLVLLAGAVRYAVRAIAMLRLEAEVDGASGRIPWHVMVNMLYSAPVWLAGMVAAVAALLGARRTAGVSAAVCAVLAIDSRLLLVGDHSYWSQYSAIPALFGLMSVVALAISPGPRRARELLGVRAVLAAGLLAVGAGSSNCLVTGGPLMADYRLTPGFGSLPAVLMLLAFVLAAVWLMRTAPGRRACALLLIPLSPLLLTSRAVYFELSGDRMVMSLVVLPGATLLLVLLGPGLFRKAAVRALHGEEDCLAEARQASRHTS